jgi:hypothetical protein
VRSATRPARRRTSPPAESRCTSSAVGLTAQLHRVLWKREPRRPPRDAALLRLKAA